MATVYQRLHNAKDGKWDFAVIRRRDAPAFPVEGDACKIKIDGDVLIIDQDSIPHWEVTRETVHEDKRRASAQHRIRLVDITDVTYYVETKIIVPNASKIIT